MSQPPYSPYPPDPYSGQPGSGAPQGYPPPGAPQQPPGYPPPPSSGGEYPPPQPGQGGQVYGGQQHGGQVYGGQQYGGQQYGNPQYGNPQYGSQQYGSQQYGSQQYGSPQSGTEPQFNAGPQYNAGSQYGTPPPTTPPKKKSSALKIVLIVVAVIAVLCVAGAGVVFFAAKDKVEQVVDATKISVVEPATLGGRAKATDPTLQASVSQLDNELSKVPGATGSVGAAYGDIRQQDLVMVAAASSLSGSAESRFAEFTSGISRGGMTLDNLTDTDPGPLGGIAKCGESKTAGVPMAICVWSDNGSIGMFAMLFKEKADLEKEFVAMRGQVEKKS